MNHDLITFLGNLNYILIAAAFMMSNILYLRILTILSSICAVIYYLNYLNNPLWINVFWESTFISINLFQIFLIYYAKRSVYFDEEEKQIYEDIFPKLTTSEYRKLLKISNFVDAEKDEILIEQGTQVLYLILICQGLVSIEIDGKITAYCGVGNLLGEMSFVSGKPATATVRVVQPTRYIVWLQKDLEKLLHNNPEMLKSMQIVFNTDLIKKLNAPPVKPLEI
ncbi:MAG: cyclic nucleotide-binding domain-containing protein [Parachlamydiaceae bacterium]|nr:cyclic nucleotide-binding domain-containing protein [Parachlamydiaceae bacterium]